MSYRGESPNVKRIRYTPQAADPVNPAEGDVFYSDGTARPEGLWVYKDGSWQQDGGDGAAGRLYFTDRDAADLGKLDLYNDGGATPTDGTGGTVAGVTEAINSSTPIIGTGSYRVSKDAADRQGQGWSIETDVALDAPITAGEPLTVQFRYRTSADYADGDIRMYYYLVGDNELFALNGIDNRGVFGNDLNAETGDRGQFTASINATSATTSVRIIGHIASTNATAYDLDIDEITIGTAATLTSPIVSDWVEYTPAIGGAGTVSNVFFSYKRVGETLFIRGRFTCGTVASSVATVALPSGLTIKTNNSSREYVGTYITGAATTNTNKMGPSIVDNNTSVLNFGRSNYAIGAGADDLLNGNNIWTSSENVFVLAEVQVNEWQGSTNIVSQTQANFQNAYSNVSLSSTQAVANATDTKIQFDSIDDESGGAFSTSAHEFTAPKKGICRVNASIRFFANSSGVRILRVYRNNSLYRELDLVSGTSGTSAVAAGGSVEVPVEKGDVLDIRARQTSGVSLDIGADANEGNHASFRMMEDLSVIGLAGQIDEYLEASLTSGSEATTSVADTYVDSSTLQLTLTPGTWRLGYDLPLGTTKASSAGTVAGNVAIRDASNNVVANSLAYVSTANHPVATNVVPISKQCRVTISETTTYKISTRAALASAAGEIAVFGEDLAGGLTNPDASSVFWAERIK